MREVSVERITEAVRRLSVEANTRLGDDVVAAFERFREGEQSPTGRDVLAQLLENARIARDEGLPLCQDTGFAVVFVDLGQDVHLVGGDLYEAVNEGVRQGYREGYLRKSIVADPLRRKNTGDNTPAVVHVRLVPGDRVRITFAPKGGGSENMSGIAMLKPADGVEGVKRFVIDRVRQAGPNPCPPTIVGVGIGGTFEIAALLAKRALLRPVGDRNPDPFYGDLEEELLAEVNRLGIGPAGLGGTTTSLDVHIEVHPCHIASLPVAVNIQCHSARHKEVEL
ncbi:fumarate hydratase [Deferrisoma camini]|uniref:fumarate hydratase n=1 Tax=Deferrisoma camini TaxID=1035120 RepID=UPI00046CAA06|nr:fumarate hydratase [Deferrisoma camini]